MGINIMEFVLVLLKNLFIVGAVGIYYLALVYIIYSFLKALDWVFRR
ncbi:MAG: hypothetical protein E7F83_16250 [Clostridium sp.]|nr:hypothetical protein [Clostridium sp.]MDU3548958.1 hypothetical protein [Clostridium sp.]